MVIGGAGSDLIDGGSGDDTLQGDSDADTIYDGTGADLIEGGGDADTILLLGDGVVAVTAYDTTYCATTEDGVSCWGGDADTLLLLGDGESDTIAFSDLADAGDTVTGFDASAPGSGGDVIDLADLLAGLGYDHGVDDINAWLTLVDGGTDTTLNVDLDGAGGGTDNVDLVTLQGVDLIGAGFTVNDLITSGNLDVDPS